jgi:uncharacterized protein (TIGR03437 family)
VLLSVVAPTPVISGLVPSAVIAGGPGFVLTVNGSGFLDPTVQWEGQALTTTVISAAQLTAAVPASLYANPGMAHITVVNRGVAAPSAAALLTINVPPPFALNGISPTSAPAGTAGLTLTVSATSVQAGANLMWNGAAVPLVSTADPNTWTAAIPAGLLTTPGTATVSISNPNGVVSASVTFTINAVGPPVISSLNPSSAAVGSATLVLTVNSSAFDPAATVLWNAQALGTTFVNSTKLTALVPATLLATAGQAPVTVANPGGNVSAPVNFTIVAAPPVITSVSPNAAPAGSAAITITVNGSNFGASSVVNWNGQALVTTLLSGNGLTAAVPAALLANPGTASLIVVNSDSGTSAAATFTVAPPGPFTSTAGIVNAASSQPSIAPGSLISIYGSSLASANGSAANVPLPQALSGTSVTVDGTPVPLLFVSPTQINAQVPYEAKTGDVKVIVKSGSAQSLPVDIQVQPTGPGVLTVLPTNHALVVNVDDGSPNSTQSPAKPGHYVTAYLTGQGLLDNPVPTGAAAPLSPFSHALADVQAKIGGQAAVVQFAGLAPNFVGLLQLNLQVPIVAPGEQSFEVSIGGVAANVTIISVGQ